LYASLFPLCVDVSAALTEYSGKVVKQTRFNPKALRAPEMYGEVRRTINDHTSEAILLLLRVG
jgi:hypothetical protein